MEIVIEICTNDEYIENNVISVKEIDEILAAEAAAEWSDKAFDAIASLGLEPVRPGGQRRTYHGWNGSRFPVAGRGWGSFDKIDKETEAKIAAALQAVTDKINADYA